MMLRLAAIILLATAAATPARAREFALDLWDWTTPCRDLESFKSWALDMKSIGVTRVEISAPWNLLEPQPGQYDLSFITDRLAVAKSHGLGLRIRINSFHSGATPAWYDGHFWRDINGDPPAGTPCPPSITDARFWHSFGRLCTRIAAELKGEDVYYSPFIGIHAELKWSDWWHYDDSTIALWRKQTSRQRPQWLRDIVGSEPLPDIPPIPAETSGTPDMSVASRATIAFREQIWRDALRRFIEGIRAGDPDARISVPLGESFRRGSAQISNLDYHGLSRGAAQVVHSYDFFWHTDDEPWHAAASVAAFRGITGVETIAFEFDGPALLDHLGYKSGQLLAIADEALAQGASLKCANYSGYPRLPSHYPILKDFARRARSAPSLAPSPKDQTILLFLSKWTNYSYREPTEWLHDAQFGAWRMLTHRGIAVRIICEDNLDEEDLTGYRGLYVAFSPPQLLPEKPRATLRQLVAQIPCIVELNAIPSAPPTQSLPPLAPQRDGNRMHLNYPLAWAWLKTDRRGQLDRKLDSFIRQTWGRK